MTQSCSSAHQSLFWPGPLGNTSKLGGQRGCQHLAAFIEVLDRHYICRHRQQARGRQPVLNGFVSVTAGGPSPPRLIYLLKKMDFFSRFHSKGILYAIRPDCPGRHSHHIGGDGGIPELLGVASTPLLQNPTAA